MKPAETIVFFGNERLATGVHTDTPVLRALIKNGYHVACVVANYERGLSRNARELEISSLAETHGIPLLLPDKLSIIAEQLRGFGAAAGVLVAYGKLIPQSIIDIFPYGIINLHPSLLPRHRGPTPIESTLLNGDKTTGVSLMRLAQKMDAGPIYAQSQLQLAGSESKQGLADRSLEIGAAMLIELLPEIISGQVIAAPQDETAATYDALITKNQGLLDWSKPADILEREIRAYLEWPKSRTILAGTEVIITKAHAVPSVPVNAKLGNIAATKETGIIVYASNGSICIERLKPAGKQEMSAAAFLAGYGAKL